MIKASEGGGGKGIRKVTSAEDFPNLFRQVWVVLGVPNTSEELSCTYLWSGMDYPCPDFHHCPVHAMLGRWVKKHPPIFGHIHIQY